MYTTLTFIHIALVTKFVQDVTQIEVAN